MPIIIKFQQDDLTAKAGRRKDPIKFVSGQFSGLMVLFSGGSQSIKKEPRNMQGSFMIKS